MNKRDESDRHADLLVELGCEELPPKSLQRLAQAFFDGTCKGLADAGIKVDPSSGSLFYTPRRMGFRLKDVPSKQPDQVTDRRGPALSAAFDANGKPTPAALGFARSVSCAPEDLDRISTDKGEWLFYRMERPGKSLDELLFPILEKALSSLPVAKPMRWSDHDFSFVRPVHWLLVLHGSRIPGGVLYGKESGRETFGHRVHNPGPHTVSSSGDYESVLRNAFVIVEPGERKESIRQLALGAGLELGGATRMTRQLLDEVTNIVEWPVAVLCQFETEFLEVPQEALIASMEDHQKFFPVLNEQDERLTPGFVAIANIESLRVESVREGFERVMRPRLADARFFWEQDIKRPLEAYSETLDTVVFQNKLGSIGDKSRRIAEFGCKIAEVTKIDSQLVRRAAHLCKCDLMTQMVGEFPELQGTMGSHYARFAGESEQVSLAIREHYFPRFAGDDIPSGDEGMVLSVADRVDSLVGIFAAGLKPTGNKDPFALRRAALGAVRILMEPRMAISLDTLLGFAADGLKDRIAVTSECLASVRSFMLERLRQYFLEGGYNTSVVNAVFAAPLTSLPDLHERLKALSGFMQQAEAASLVAANKRIGNILRKSESSISTNIDHKLMIIGEEEILFEEIKSLETALDPLMKAGDYSSALANLVSLDSSISAFFDRVMVMDKDPLVRDNRLALLARLKGLFDGIADLGLAT